MPRDTGITIRDKIEGNECDLSLSDLTVVPVKELAAVPKATHLDLSCNILTSLPAEFCQLTHLVRLDLSKNALTSLPDKFGALQRLQHVDLFSNKLTTLPLSFSRLKNLKWLDVKDNQLSEQMMKVTGDCLDDIQCKQCAKNVISYMKQAEAENQRQIQKKLQEEREKEAALKAETERLNKERREQKKLERERRRKEYEESTAQKQTDIDSKEEETSIIKPSEVTDSIDKVPKQKGGIGCMRILLTVLVGIIAVVIGVYFYCHQNADEEICRRAAFQVRKYQYYFNKYVDKYFPRNH